MGEAKFMDELAKNGPWAAVAGFLLWTVIKAWNKDRDQVTVLLGEFRVSLEKLATEIHNLGEIQRQALNETKEARKA